MRESEEQHRIAREWQFYNENSLKAWKGRAGRARRRRDDAEAGRRRARCAPIAQAESRSRSAIRRDREGAREVQAAVSGATTRSRSGRRVDLLTRAIRLVRAADERARRRTASASTSIATRRCPDIEQKVLSTGADLSGAREARARVLARQGPRGARRRRSDGRALLGKDSPEQVAARLVDGTKLGDAPSATRLFEGRQGRGRGVARSDDRVRRACSTPAARKVRKVYDDEVEGVTKRRAREDREGAVRARGPVELPRRDVHAAPVVRRGEGLHVDGARQEGRAVHDMGGAFDRATGQPPFDLPKSWLDAKRKVDPRTPFDFATTNDIIGGNSGSPVFDQKRADRRPDLRRQHRVPRR